MDNYYNNYVKYKHMYQKLKGGANPLNSNKVKGCLYGHTVGDALGTKYIFMNSKKATENVEQDLANNSLNKLPILGGGPFNVEKGQGTDVTEMMLCLATTVLKNKRYDQDEVAKSYIKWFKTKPVTVSGTMKKALETQDTISVNSQDMIDNSREMNKLSVSNSVLVRCPPLAILGLGLETDELKNTVYKESDLTHPSEVVKNMVFIYCLAIKYSVRGYSKEKIFDILINNSTIHPRVRISLLNAKDGVKNFYIIDSQCDEIFIQADNKIYQGYVGVAFQTAFYEFLHNDNFYDSMVSIVKAGGDVSANCATAGALLGAYYGFDLIDKDWLDSLEKSDPTRYKKYPELDPMKVLPQIL